MEEKESIGVLPDENNGNVSVMEETPPVVTETSTEVPAEVETVVPTEPEVELFELPDGKKVDAATLAREWKENFYPDYTRKSQALAAKEQPITNTSTDPYADPDYVPSSYKELEDRAAEKALAKFQELEAIKIAQEKDREAMVDAQIAEVKKIDPAVNENELFVHANTYRGKGIVFADLKAVYHHKKELSELAKKVQAQTAKDVAKRSDPVSVSPGAIGTRPEPSQFASSQEYLRALKASGM